MQSETSTPDIIELTRRLHDLLLEAKEFVRTEDLDMRRCFAQIEDVSLTIQETASLLFRENSTLKNKREVQQVVRVRGEFGYCYKEGDDEPLCPRCFQKDQKVVYLPPVEQYGNKGLLRKCVVCDFQKLEERAEPDRVVFTRSAWLDTKSYL
jgi:hypothetical protein